MMFPRYSELIDQYMDLERSKAKKPFRAEHPELEMFWEWPRQFAQTHQVWAKYYLPDEYMGEGGVASARETGGAAGAAAGGGGGGRGYRRGGGGGGGGSPVSIRSWDDFMLLANPAAVQQFFAFVGGEKGDLSALQELHAQIGRGSFMEWIAWLVQLYQSQWKPTTRTPRVVEPRWLPGIR